MSQKSRGQENVKSSLGSLRYVCSIILRIFVLSLFLTGDTSFTAHAKSTKYLHSIPLAGNSWAVGNAHAKTPVVTKQGIQHWNHPNTRIRSFFYAHKIGTLRIGIRARVHSASTIRININRQSKQVRLVNTSYQDIPIGTFHIRTKGYQVIEFKGVKKSQRSFLEASHILLGGAVAQGKVTFVKTSFYWGRRGPSVHLIYKTPKVKNAVWFYNEVTVPKGMDPIGSFFMPVGFRGGYFGFQVNSPSKRVILFSVWSPYRTDNPNKVPKKFRVKLLKKGPSVSVRRFGGEGSGGQSFRKYMWKAGVKYRFLIKGKPFGKVATDFTAYFYSPSIKKWELIASFRRPMVNTHLLRIHSFIESFIPKYGYLPRRAVFSNPWVRDANNKWHSIQHAIFSADNTARKKERLDYFGGLMNHQFFLMNCGFINQTLRIGTRFVRKKSKNPPAISLDGLQ